MAAVHFDLPRISVVVPSFNQGRFLREALDSIFTQNYPNLEVLVMDGGSTDNSVSIIHSYAHRLHYWQSQTDGGQSSAINAGVSRCSGDLVAWLNSDDLYWGNALWSVANAYMTYPNHGLYVGNGLRLEHDTGIHTAFCSRHVAFDREALLHGTDYILQPSVFFLRSAWNNVAGLNQQLSFCMDWDIFLRISNTYPVVTLQEFLSVSREYGETKTRSGKMKRAAEIVRMIQSHTDTEVTPGSLVFLFQTLCDVTPEGMSQELSDHLSGALNVVAREISIKYGGGHGFPERTDSQGKCYLPFATPRIATCTSPSATIKLPSISIVAYSLNQREYLRDTLESICNQGYSNLETLVIDGGSHDGSLNVLTRFSDHVTHCIDQDRRGCAHAINRGLTQAKSEIVAWLNPGDLIAAGALEHVGPAFASDPDLDMVYGNAVHINETGQLSLEHHNSYLSGLWIAPNSLFEAKSEAALTDIEIPQPTLFFRRRLLDRCGVLDHSLRHIYDCEWIVRVAPHAKTQKLERIQALVRTRASDRDAWNERLVELYRFNRKRWAGLFSKEFPGTLREFVASFMRRKFGGRPNALLTWGAAALVATSALTRLGNPETLWKNRLHRPCKSLAPLSAPRQSESRFHSLFCTSEIGSTSANTEAQARTLQILRCLRQISSVDYFCQRPGSVEMPDSELRTLVDVIHTPETIALIRPDLIHPRALRQPLQSRLASLLRHFQVPVLGPRFPLHVTEAFPFVHAYSRLAIQEMLDHHAPDFLFVSPQANPLALVLATRSTKTRLVLIANEPEAERMQTLSDSYHGIARLAADWEANRASTFERDNLERYDGVIVPNESTRQSFIKTYGFPGSRIRVIGNELDVGLGDWLEHLQSNPRRLGAGLRGRLPEPTDRPCLKSERWIANPKKYRFRRRVWKKIMQTAADGIMGVLAGASGAPADWAWSNPREAALAFAQERSDFVLEEPAFLFNEGTVREQVTYWPSAYLKRVA